MMYKYFIAIFLVGCLLLFGGCATDKILVVPDVFKSSEQIKLQDAKTALKAAEIKQKNLEEKVPRFTLSLSKEINQDVIDYRVQYLQEREAYLKTLRAELNVKIVSLEKKAMDSGYFDLGATGLGIASGIASAVLVVASPANAATVAGLGAFSSGILAFGDKATEVGYSTIAAHKQISVLKGSAHVAYTGFKKVPWEYLHAIVATADKPKWEKAMETLGAQIVAFEAAVRYTKFDVELVTKTKPE